MPCNLNEKPKRTMQMRVNRTHKKETEQGLYNKQPEDKHKGLLHHHDSSENAPPNHHDSVASAQELV